ncbi:MAG: hypothetical protein AAF721_37225, partial [Myxococcota bacterium]
LRTMNFTSQFLGIEGGWQLLNTNAGVWDPAGRRALMLGQGLVAYDEASNAWSTDARPCPDCLEGADHLTINPTTGELFRRTFSGNTVLRLGEDDTDWAPLPEIPTDHRDCCYGLEYFTARDELVYADLDGVFLYSFQDGTWSQPWGELGFANRTFVEHSAVHELVLILGGTDAPAYVLDREANLIEMQPPPVEANYGETVVTPDLVTGNFIVLSGSNTMYIYDPIADTWETVEGDVPPLQASQLQAAVEVVATPVSTACVTMFASHDYDASSVWLYRHGE